MLKTLFTSKKTVFFNKIMKMAVELHQKLRWASSVENGMDRIVEFFQTTSPYHDQFLELVPKFSEPIQFKDEKQQKFFDDFQRFIKNSGRSQSGWNRTNPGELPTSDNVWVNMLVPYDEIFMTRKVSAHLSRRNNPKGEVDHIIREGAEGKWNETNLVENDFVNPFIKKNYEHLCRIIKEYGK